MSAPIASTLYVLLEFRDASLLVPRDEVRAMDEVGTGGMNDRVLESAADGGLCPLFRLPPFDPVWPTPPDAARDRLTLGNGDSELTLLCQSYTPLELEEGTGMTPLPECMRLHDTPITHLLWLDEALFLVSGAEALSTYLHADNEHG